MKYKPVTIRDLDPELYRLARSEAIKEGKTIGQWLNELICNKCGRTTTKEEK